MENEKIICIEDGRGHNQTVLKNVMGMVPRKDRSDIALQRLIAFRLRTDGENATRHYLIHQIRTMSQCTFTGRLYDFLKNDHQSKTCEPAEFIPEPPDRA